MRESRRWSFVDTRSPALGRSIVHAPLAPVPAQAPPQDQMPTGKRVQRSSRQLTQAGREQAGNASAGAVMPQPPAVGSASSGATACGAAAAAIRGCPGSTHARAASSSTHMHDVQESTVGSKCSVDCSWRQHVQRRSSGGGREWGGRPRSSCRTSTQRTALDDSQQQQQPGQRELARA